MIDQIGSKTLALAVMLATMLFLAPAAGAQTNEDPRVQGVLFFSPTCGHCEYVIQNVLPPLFDENGGPWDLYYDETLAGNAVPYYLLDNGMLQFLLVDVSVETGAQLFAAATDRYNIESNGVPRMVIDDQVFVGSADIPDALPGIVSDGLNGSGIEWPSLPGVEDAVASIPAPVAATTTVEPSAGTTSPATGVAGEDPVPTTAATGSAVLPAVEEDSVADRFGRDPVGNTLAVIVLVGMLASLGAVAMVWRRSQTRGGGTEGSHPSLAIPAIAVIGIAVAAYLTYVETSDTEAVCGPVGDCNAVQQSEYAELFGLIPVGVVGLIGYVVVIGAWLLARTDRKPVADMARIALLAGTTGGVLLSAYLTFLEPFVIGATCAWCLTSAVIITALMWLAVGPAALSWSKLRAGRRQIAG